MEFREADPTISTSFLYGLLGCKDPSARQQVARNLERLGISTSSEVAGSSGLINREPAAAFLAVQPDFITRSGGNRLDALAFAVRLVWEVQDIQCLDSTLVEHAKDPKPTIMEYERLLINSFQAIRPWTVKSGLQQDDIRTPDQPTACDVEDALRQIGDLAGDLCPSEQSPQALPPLPNSPCVTNGPAVMDDMDPAAQHDRPQDDMGTPDQPTASEVEDALRQVRDLAGDLCPSEQSPQAFPPLPNSPRTTNGPAVMDNMDCAAEHDQGAAPSHPQASPSPPNSPRPAQQDNMWDMRPAPEHDQGAGPSQPSPPANTTILVGRMHVLSRCIKGRRDVAVADLSVPGFSEQMAFATGLGLPGQVMLIAQPVGEAGGKAHAWSCPGLDCLFQGQPSRFMDHLRHHADHAPRGVRIVLFGVCQVDADESEGRYIFVSDRCGQIGSRRLQSITLQTMNDAIPQPPPSHHPFRPEATPPPAAHGQRSRKRPSPSSPSFGNTTPGIAHGSMAMNNMSHRITLLENHMNRQIEVQQSINEDQGRINEDQGRINEEQRNQLNDHGVRLNECAGILKELLYASKSNADSLGEVIRLHREGL